MDKQFRTENWRRLSVWLVLCLCTSLFMGLSVDLEETLWLINLGGLSVVVVGVAGLLLIFNSTSALTVNSKSSRQSQVPSQHHTCRTIIFQLFLVLVAIVQVNQSVLQLRQKSGLSFSNQIINWTSIILAVAVPFLRPASLHLYNHRLIIIFLAFSPGMILLSVSYEILFYSFLSCTLYAWLDLERVIYKHIGPGNNLPSFVTTTAAPAKLRRGDASHVAMPDKRMEARALRVQDTRIALLFLFFINVAFFGTGNIASVASFTLSSVYRLTTVFSPFLMGMILVFKILSPFFVLSASLSLLSNSLNLPPLSLFLVTVCTTDIMTINFFFLVRDFGSWLEIGTSISHFVIGGAFEVVMVLLIGLGHVLVDGSIVPQVFELKMK